VQTATELAALDDISEGRAVLGLGSSVKLWIEDQLGLRYARPAAALAAVIEAGITSPVLYFPPPIDFEQAARDAERHLLAHFL
jgi:alkanesulfonate monooxygenase SsuD/methylene tetrahydromethanopterin reductase-like flavin-dependent oxidoreductase (luciferase family)